MFSMKKCIISGLTVISLSVFSLTAIAAQSTSDNYSLTGSVISSAGSASESTNYKIVSTFGQSTATGNSESTNYKLSAGFLSIDFTPEMPSDLDGDGVADSNDNCTLVPNHDQRDTDGDLYGNMCDADLNNIGMIVNNTDRALFIQVFGKSSALNPDADFDGVGSVINNADRAIFTKLFGKTPGPSGLR